VQTSLRVEQAVILHFPTYDKLNEVRQRVVVDMAFNIGLTALAFKACIADVEKSDWSGAAKELFRSEWAYQVDDGPGGKYGRADRLSYMLLTGTDVTGANAIPGLSTV
jgi:lysozyme